MKRNTKLQPLVFLVEQSESSASTRLRFYQASRLIDYPEVRLMKFGKFWKNLPTHPSVVYTNCLMSRKQIDILRSKGHRIIFDFCDPIYSQCQYRDQPSLYLKIKVFVYYLLTIKKALQTLMNADLVITNFLPNYDWVKQRHDRVRLVMDPIDIKKYRPHPKKGRGILTVGWIGSPMATLNILSVAGALEKIHRKYPQVEFLAIGAGPVLAKRLPFFKVVNWGLAAEKKWLPQFDIGIVPLPDTQLNRERAGFKIMQYMALGLPVVADAVGINVTFLEKDNGLLCHKKRDWTINMEKLIKSPALRKKLGARARKRIVRFSYKIYLRKIKKIITDLQNDENRN